MRRDATRTLLVIIGTIATAAVGIMGTAEHGVWAGIGLVAACFGICFLVAFLIMARDSIIGRGRCDDPE